MRWKGDASEAEHLCVEVETRAASRTSARRLLTLSFKLCQQVVCLAVLVGECLSHVYLEGALQVPLTGLCSSMITAGTIQVGASQTQLQGRVLDGEPVRIEDTQGLCVGIEVILNGKRRADRGKALVG